MNNAESRGNIESVMSCIVAWTLKMFDEKNHNGHANKVLLLECRKILSESINRDVTQLNCSAETYLEWKRIDLVAKVCLKEIEEYHVFLSENRVCVGLPPHELPTKKVFEDYYKEREELNYIVSSYALILLSPSI